MLFVKVSDDRKHQLQSVLLMVQAGLVCPVPFCGRREQGKASRKMRPGDGSKEDWSTKGRKHKAEGSWEAAELQEIADNCKEKERKKNMKASLASSSP